jgi:hypothetical protein
MARTAAKFRQADLARALKAAAAAGMTVARVELEDGKIVLHTGGSTPAEPMNDLDKWMASRARKAQEAQ